MNKQVIVIRKDLKMRRGKEVAQGAHASMKVIFDNNWYYDLKSKSLTIENVNEDIITWLNGIFTKICVTVNSEQELIDIYNEAKENDIPCSIIQDNGLTEFHNVPTYTCCAIGPYDSEKLDLITGHLPLY